MRTIFIGLGILICTIPVIIGVVCIIVGSRSEKEFRDRVVDIK